MENKEEDVDQATNSSALEALDFNDAVHREADPRQHSANRIFWSLLFATSFAATLFVLVSTGPVIVMTTLFAFTTIIIVVMTWKSRAVRTSYRQDPFKEPKQPSQWWATYGTIYGFIVLNPFLHDTPLWARLVYSTAAFVLAFWVAFDPRFTQPQAATK